MQEVSPALARLDQLPARTCGIVRRMEARQEDGDRLKTLGVCVGRQIELVKPGNPMIIRVFGSRLGISAQLASQVWVEGCGGRCTCPAMPAT